MEQKSAKEKAFERAHDIRKFEIELYWKRTTYFWAFLITSFGGYFAILTSNNEYLNSENKGQYLFLIESIGFIFSLGWFYVNRASKHWQINWEKVIDQLEDEITGPLMKTNIINHNKYINFVSSYKFSVSRVNQIISFFIVFIWMILMISTSISIIKGFKFDVWGSWMYPLTLLTVILFTLILTIWGMSEGGHNGKIIQWREKINKKLFGSKDIENTTLDIIVFPSEEKSNGELKKGTQRPRRVPPLNP